MFSGVYTNDELPAAGVNLRINEKENNDYFSHSITLPPSLSQTIGLFPVIFLSSNSMYPTAEEYTWRVSYNLLLDILFTIFFFKLIAILYDDMI